MKGLLFVIFLCGLLESSNSFSCYTCNSETGGACSREEAGNVTECAEGFGCLISEERSPKAGDFLLRECLAGQETDYKCETITSEDGVTVQTCACSTELCNKDWADAGSTQPNGETVKCYSCDSKTGDCDDAHSGTETDCPAWQGCYITKNNEDDYIRGCSVNSVPGCIDDGINHSCDCLTDLCNADWDTAGAESKMKCYSCDSHEGECDESHAGTEIDCSMEEGCSISTNVFDGKTLFSRGCSGELDTKGCNNEDNATTCICLETLCNFDWSTAGSTIAGSDTTQPSTVPGSAGKMFPAFSVVLGVAGAIVGILLL